MMPDRHIIAFQLAKFQKITKFWDFGTIISAASMILVFAYQAYRQPNLLLKFGVILIVVWCLFLIYIVIKLKKTKPHEANNYREYLEQNKQYLENQISISNKFMSLTILPCFSGVALIMVGKLNLINKSWSEIVNINMVWIGFKHPVFGFFICNFSFGNFEFFIQQLPDEVFVDVFFKNNGDHTKPKAANAAQLHHAGNGAHSRFNGIGHKLLNLLCGQGRAHREHLRLVVGDVWDGIDGKPGK